MKMRHLLILGGVFFLWALLMNAPAATLNAWFAPKAAPAPGATQVQLYGVQGTLDQGSASALGINDRPVVRELRWSFQPWWLPLLRASFHVDGGGDQLRLDGRAAFVFGGVNLASAHVAGGLKALLDIGSLGYAPLDGEGRLDIDSLKLRGGLPAYAVGKAEVHNLAWTLSKDPLVLGDFKADFTTTDGTITGKISSEAGAVDATGEVHLKADHSYDYDLRLKTKPGADPMLVNLLDSLGPTGPDGSHRLAAAGKLAQTP